jgi:catechol 2,3-dioxygenase-like lactoylglutathione lyase family enzyme
MASTTKAFTARLRYATFKSKHLHESVRFYEDILGFPRTKTADDFVQLDAGGAELCVDLDDGGEFAPQLIFAIDDLHAAHDHLRQAGVEIISGGPDQPWLMFRDPDGNEVVFEK